MPTATVKLQMTYTPPAAASNSGVPVIDTTINYEAQNVGALDIPVGIAPGTVFQIPFGSIAGAQLLMIRNATSNPISLKVNGAGADLVALPDATILSTLIALANDIKAKYNAHIANTNGPFHAVPDSANVVTSPNASDLATAITLLNEIKGDYNAHIGNTGGAYHAVVDTANVVTSANATDLPTAVVLANEIKADYNAHRIQGVHYQNDTARLESGGTFSYFQPTIPSVNPVNSAQVTIITAPTTATEFVYYWVLGT